MKKNVFFAALLLVMTEAVFAQSWSLTGNAGTTSADYVGTTDANPLRFGVKGGSAGIIDSASKNTGIGLGFFNGYKQQRAGVLFP